MAHAQLCAMELGNYKKHVKRVGFASPPSVRSRTVRAEFDHLRFDTNGKWMHGRQPANPGSLS